MMGKLLWDIIIKFDAGQWQSIAMQMHFHAYQWAWMMNLTKKEASYYCVNIENTNELPIIKIKLASFTSKDPILKTVEPFISHGWLNKLSIHVPQLWPYFNQQLLLRIQDDIIILEKRWKINLKHVEKIEIKIVELKYTHTWTNSIGSPGTSQSKKLVGSWIVLMVAMPNKGREPDE
uniref:Uncharacterized protein n=1 Tax=Romanomermis culicivorax TaxID=13658 RepID=A0A915LBP8_ROMCU